MIGTHVVCPETSAPFIVNVGILSWLQTGLFDSRAFSNKALYRKLVGGGVWDYLNGELCVTKKEGHVLWLWAPEMRCLNNNEASLT